MREDVSWFALPAMFQGIQVGVQAEVPPLLAVRVRGRGQVPQHQHQPARRDRGHHGLRAQDRRQEAAAARHCRGRALVQGGHRAAQGGQRLQGDTSRGYYLK